MSNRVSPQQIYQEVDSSITSNINQQGKDNVSGLAKAVVVANSAPIATFYDIINAFPKLTPELVEKAAQAFSKTTGFHPSQLSVNNVSTSPAKQIGKKIVNYNAFYIFFPMGFVWFVAIWLMVGFGWLNWVVGIYLSMLLILIVYIFDVVYRINAQHAIDNVVDEQTSSSSSSSNMETFVAYLPQLVHAIGTALNSS